MPDPNGVEPILATAFICYSKPDEPSGNPAVWVAKALKEFLAEQSPKQVEDEPRFRHQIQPDGQTRSLCLSCFDSVAVTTDLELIAASEATHTC